MRETEQEREGSEGPGHVIANKTGHDLGVKIRYVYAAVEDLFFSTPVEIGP